MVKRNNRIIIFSVKGMKKEMKKRKFNILMALIIMLSVGVMSGCSKQVEGTDVTDYHVVPEETEFCDIIAGNPIDEDIAMDAVENEVRIKDAARYRDAWNKEIENTLNILNDNLTTEEYQQIEQSYSAWQQHMQSFTNVEQSLFYIGGVAGDSITYPRVTEISAIRTKEYAVQLMSIEYAITGNVEFIY